LKQQETILLFDNNECFIILILRTILTSVILYKKTVKAAI